MKRNKIALIVFIIFISFLLISLLTNKKIQLIVSCRFGNTQNCYKLGEIYELGKGTKKDYKEAKVYYSIACDRGMMLACHYLGTLYYRGKIRTKDFSLKHIELFKKACDGGIKESCEHMELMRTSLEALKYYNQCQKGNFDACRYYRFLIAKAYKLKSYIYTEYCNRGDEDACDELRILYGDACEMGDRDACYKLRDIWMR